MNFKSFVTELVARVHALPQWLLLFSNLCVDQYVMYSYTYGILSASP